MWGSSNSKHRRRQPRRLVRGVITTTGVVAVAVTVGLVGTGGTYALWGTSLPVSHATIRTGTVGLTVNDGSAASLGNLGSNLGPGDTVGVAVTLANTGSTALKVGVVSTAAADSPAALTTALHLTLAPVAATTSCPTGVATGAPLSDTASRDVTTLAPGASQRVCVELTLDAGASQDAAGKNAAFTLTFTGNQS